MTNVYEEFNLQWWQNFQALLQSSAGKQERLLKQKLDGFSTTAAHAKVTLSSNVQQQVMNLINVTEVSSKNIHLGDGVLP